jgi:hypothetical protein
MQTVFGLFLATLIGGLILIANVRANADDVVCTRFGHVGQRDHGQDGSCLVELLLWLFFLLPGLIYTVWRLTTSGKSCAKCGADEIVPADSPRGRQVIEQLQSND